MWRRSSSSDLPNAHDGQVRQPTTPAERTEAPTRLGLGEITPVTAIIVSLSEENQQASRSVRSRN
jgi:hypothetical protein